MSARLPARVPTPDSPPLAAAAAPTQPVDPEVLDPFGALRFASRVDATADWREIEGLALASYRHFALARMLKALDQRA